jgi:hypothetical protein
MKKFLLLTIIMMVIFLSPGSVTAQTNAEGYRAYLPIVLKPFPEPICDIEITVFTPNYVKFDIGCQNVPNGWAHIMFDTLGHDSAKTDIAITNGIGYTDHYYPWPFTNFEARLTVTGLDGRGYDFNVPVNIYWP